jgi:hypothetical protein
MPQLALFEGINASGQYGLRISLIVSGYFTRW